MFLILKESIRRKKRSLQNPRMSNYRRLPYRQPLRRLAVRVESRSLPRHL
jgi:hypothetical protein